MSLPVFKSQVQMQVTVSSPGLRSTKYIPPMFPQLNDNAPGSGPIAYALVQGNNDGIAVPPGTLAVLLVPDPASTYRKIVCNNSGSSFAGVEFKSQPVYFPIVSGQGLYIYCDAAEEILIQWL